MISSIQGYASGLPASHAAQAASPEVAGEAENDGDRDDVAGAVKAMSPGMFPAHVGSKINTLA